MESGFERERSVYTTLDTLAVFDISCVQNIAVNGYIPRILDQIDQLKQAITRFEGQPVPINDIMPWFAFDSMGEFAFNQSFNMLKEGKWNSVILSQHLSLAIQGLLHPAVWAMRLAFACAFFLPIGPFKDWFSLLQFSDQCMENRMKVTCYGIISTKFVLQSHILKLAD